MKAKVNFAEDYRLESVTKHFLRELNSGGAGLVTMAVESPKQVLIDSQASIPVDVFGIVEGEVTITQDGYHLKVNIVLPDGSGEKLPVFIFIHSGGWLLGEYPTNKRLVRDLAVKSGYIGILVNYSLSPETQYAQAVNEVYAFTKWVTTIGYNGIIHDFGLLNHLANLPITRSLITHAAAKLRKHLI